MIPKTSRRDVGAERLGIYVDDVYRVASTEHGRQISTDRAFLLFACEVGKRFDRVVLFGRTIHTADPADYTMPPEVELAELPHYASLQDLRRLGRAFAGTVAGFWRGLDRVDTVWVFGPHPFALVLVALAICRRKRVALGIRHDALSYHRSRLPSPRWKPVLGLIWVLDRLTLLLARWFPTTVMGTEMAERYSRGRARPLAITVSLVRDRDVVPRAVAGDWSGPIELLTVGRLEPEKNPLLLVDALARLEDEMPGRFKLTWIGRGALESAVRARASATGISERITLRGYVAFGPELLELYRRSHAFVHVSLTEGVPQVLVEALACGVPVVATDVGGVRWILGDGRAGLLVPPADTSALTAAVHQLANDASLRMRLITSGLEIARATTIEAESARVARYLRFGEWTEPLVPPAGASAEELSSTSLRDAHTGPTDCASVEG